MRNRSWAARGVVSLAILALTSFAPAVAHAADVEGEGEITISVEISPRPWPELAWSGSEAMIPPAVGAGAVVLGASMVALGSRRRARNS